MGFLFNLRRKKIVEHFTSEVSAKAFSVAMNKHLEKIKYKCITNAT